MSGCGTSGRLGFITAVSSNPFICSIISLSILIPLALSFRGHLISCFQASSITLLLEVIEPFSSQLRPLKTPGKMV